ncbi:hypothetical protein [Azospirillum soli]|uniref:hypothetical protein n=1 Tax=Azospirillum soli TaxID=1304799 RepID=UPI001AE24850|nr:hypothetical protein [Azospirillum soli]MBP2316826.1 hypothetical protein [Azospirillum soli]
MEIIDADDGGGVEAWIARLRHLAPDLVVTGTSYHADFSRCLWLAARTVAVRTVAVLDAWINLGERWRFADGRTSQPDALCVIDETIRQEAREVHGFSGTVHVVGQPHLEAVVARVAVRRAGRTPSSRPLLIFFSEPTAEFHTGPEYPGYDQFTSLDAFFAALPPGVGMELLVRPHPKEGPEVTERYRKRLGAWIEGRLTNEDPEALLAMADGVIGMTTMVLIEAALLGIPALSLQLDRTRIVNPAVDRLPGIATVTEATRLPECLRSFLARVTSSAPAGEPIPAGGLAMPGNAGDRLMRALKEEMAGVSRGPQCRPVMLVAPPGAC